MIGRDDPSHIALLFDESATEQRQILRGVIAFLRDQQQCQNEVLTWHLQCPSRDAPYAASSSTMQPQGIIAYSSPSHRVDSASSDHIPTVRVGLSHPETATCNAITVCPDNTSIGQFGANYLLDRNLESFGFYGYRKQLNTVWSEARRISFENTIRHARGSCHSLRVSKAHPQSSSLSTWLLSLTKPIGIMTADDLLAHQVVTTCHSLSLSVPDQVAVLGTGNDDLFCQGIHPTISSVDLTMPLLGHTAAKTLHTMLKTSTVESGTVLDYQNVIALKPTTVTARASTDTHAYKDPAIIALLREIHSLQWRKVHTAQLAKQYGLSQWQLEHRFRLTRGRSIHEEICQYRIKMTKKLLIATDRPLKEIAAQMGFASLQYMTTFMKRHTSLTPAQIRKLQLENALKIMNHE